jgi:hypothetical protein
MIADLTFLAAVAEGGTLEQVRDLLAQIDRGEQSIRGALDQLETDAAGLGREAAEVLERGVDAVRVRLGPDPFNDLVRRMAVACSVHGNLALMRRVRDMAEVRLNVE